MARPKKDGMDYFPHDTDAVNDEKIEALRMLYGNDGYAFYFILLERIYRTKNGEFDVSEAETIQILSKKVSVTEEKFSKMLETSLKWDCFDKDEYEKRGVLTSDGIKKRMSPVVEKRNKMRSRYKKEVSAAETKQNDGVSEHKEKKSKAKESKEEIPYKKIVDHLNEKTGKNYKPAARKTRELIQARWNEGYSLEDFKKVIDVCSQKWKGKTFSNGVYGDEYLRPSTLFNGKFDERLNWSLDDEKKVTMLDEWKSDSIKPDKSLFKISGDW